MCSGEGGGVEKMLFPLRDQFVKSVTVHTDEAGIDQWPAEQFSFKC